MGGQSLNEDGSSELPEPPRSAQLTGELVTETFEYDGGRKVTVYVPRVPAEAVVFAGDGQGIAVGSAP